LHGFLFRSENFVRKTRKLEYLFYLSREARNFYPEFNIRLYDKNSESDFFFFLHQNQNIFFSNIGNQNIFLEVKYIPNICKKAARQLNVLKRIGKHLNRLGKLTIYYSFIMSNFSYFPLTYHFCGEQNTKKIEKIQERALPFIYDDFQNSYNFC
jgi:hypothetical protein